MSDDNEVGDGTAADKSGRPLDDATSTRKAWAAPKVIVSSFVSTAIKKKNTPIDTPRPGVASPPAS
jgi:hypothetical protein